MVLEIMGGFIISLQVVFITAQGAIWYKLGRVESKLEAHLQQHVIGRLTDDDAGD